MRVRDNATHQKIKISFKAKKHHSEYQSRPSSSSSCSFTVLWDQKAGTTQNFKKLLTQCSPSSFQHHLIWYL